MQFISADQSTLDHKTIYRHCVCLWGLSCVVALATSNGVVVHQINNLIRIYYITYTLPTAINCPTHRGNRWMERKAKRASTPFNCLCPGCYNNYSPRLQATGPVKKPRRISIFESRPIIRLCLRHVDCAISQVLYRSIYNVWGCSPFMAYWNCNIP